MAGLFLHLAPLTPAELLPRLAAAADTLEVFFGRRLAKSTLVEIWRRWPGLPQVKQAQIRDLLWHAGLTARLLTAAVRGRGRRKIKALHQLLVLGDARSVAPLLAAWQRFTQEEQTKILNLVANSGHPGIATLLWQEVAVHSPDPPQVMADLARRIGSSLTDALGDALGEGEVPLWAWETMVRLGGRQALEYLLLCLGRQDRLGVRTKEFFGATADPAALPLLMQASRFHPRWEVRIGAVTALLRRKEPEALRFLSELLRDRGWYEDPMRQETIGRKPSWPGLFGLAGLH